MNTAELATLKRKVTCREFGNLLMKSPSGAVCPGGHGKVRQRPDPADVRKYQKLKNLASLPEATPVPGFKGFFTVEGRDERPYWSRVGKRSGEFSARYDGKEIGLVWLFSSRVHEAMGKRGK